MNYVLGAMCPHCDYIQPLGKLDDLQLKNWDKDFINCPVCNGEGKVEDWKTCKYPEKNSVKVNEISHYIANLPDEIQESKIVECRDFNCDYNKEFKCTLKNVRMVVIENELVCENADEPTNAGITYI